MPKQPYSSRRKTPPEFWDKLSRVPLCPRALREFNRRTIRPIAPQRRGKRDVDDSQINQLQRFARRGGPDLRSVRGYPELNSKRSRSSTKLTPFYPKDDAFEMELIDNGIHPPGYNHVELANLEEIIEKLGQRRASLSPSKFSPEKFVHFSRRNDEAANKAAVMSEVFPMITGRDDIPLGYNMVFNNLEPLGNRISNPQPDYFNCSSTAEIRPKVQDALEQYIIPSSEHYRPALPNFFMEAKGPDGKASVAKRQITQDLAAGARGMLKIQAYRLDEPVFDNKAYTFASSYQSGTGTLQLYAMHPIKPGAADSRPKYETIKLRGFDLTDSLDTHRQGIAAFRNLRDLAKERREEFIARANERADNDDESEAGPADQSTRHEPVTADSDNEESDTSMDELAMPALQTKRTKARQRGREKHGTRIGDSVIDEDDEEL
ncbi:hypothetical protein CC80DRAFT_533898 [Byssothecium circinans]|uniref:Uncharacterized protein n=1 Tax=Byssothecium circinans TaxID=147558 RepID=A0A6A5U510_9PLEO|nr:hypothetical protein CC80DRAFT_533898 [Byssothecium circinans]